METFWWKLVLIIVFVAYSKTLKVERKISWKISKDLV